MATREYVNDPRLECRAASHDEPLSHFSDHAGKALRAATWMHDHCKAAVDRRQGGCQADHRHRSASSEPGNCNSPSLFSIGAALDGGADFPLICCGHEGCAIGSDSGLPAASRQPMLTALFGLCSAKQTTPGKFAWSFNAKQ
jgi:hypothetical protein